MPKITINDQFDGNSYRVLDAAGKEVEGGVEYVAPFLHVGWDKTVGNVEIATRQGGDFADDIERPGFYVHLDRAGINRLIRTLRKARDDAFGADA